MQCIPGFFYFNVHERTITVHERTQKTVGSVFKEPYIVDIQVYKIFGTPFVIIKNDKQ